MYVYMDIYVWVCVCSWIASQGGDLISEIFEAVPKCSEDLSLYILARKELCQRKPVRPEEKDKGRQSVMKETPGWSVRSETLKRRVRHSELRTWGRAVNNEDTEQ